MNYTMADLKVGQSGIVKTITSAADLKRRLIDIGLVCGTRVLCVLKSPGGDPMAYKIRGAVIAIRNADAKNVLLESEAD